MWFRNLTVLRLPPGWSLSAAELEEQLSRRPLRPCSPLDMSSRGWVAPADGGRLVHTVERQQLIALGVEQKLLPASIIREAARERAEALAREQGFPVGRRQMRELRMRVAEELRARALCRRRVTRAWIDPRSGWFVVDAAGGMRAEEVTETLRDTLGTFAAQPLETERPPRTAMAAWLKVGSAPLRFTIDQDLQLQAVDGSKATIGYAHCPLDSREILAHLSAGMYVTRLGLTWSDRIAFVLTEKLQIRRVQFLAMSERGGGDEADAAEQFDADFALMAGELARLLDDLAQALGGEAPRQAAAA